MRRLLKSLPTFSLRVVILPCRMRGVSSEAMVMCASSPENVEILDPPTGCVVGERVVCPGYDGMWYSTLPFITTVIICRLGGVLISRIFLVKCLSVVGL